MHKNREYFFEKLPYLSVKLKLKAEIISKTKKI